MSASAASSDSISAKIACYLAKMLSGSIDVGARTPIRDAPAWVTLKVLQGGFASGELSAALSPGDEPNEAYLTEEGVQRLSEMLDSGCYRVQHAEHGALPVVIWLIRSGRIDEAAALVAEISPHFEKIRFYPDAADTPLNTPQAKISVCTVAELRAQLGQLLDEGVKTECQMRCAKKCAALERWLPLKHSLLDLFARTLGCEHPPVLEAPKVEAEVKAEAEAEAEAPPLNDKEFRKTRFPPESKIADPACGCDVKGRGWPLERFPAGWYKAANELLGRYEEILERPDADLNPRHREEGTSLHTLIMCLRACIDAGRGAAAGDRGIVPAKLSLNTLYVGRLRSVLAGWHSTRGLPGTERFNRYVGQLPDSSLPSTAKFAQAIDKRLASYDQSAGLDNPDEVLGDLPPSISQEDGRPNPIPEGLKDKVRRTKRGTVVDLIKAGIITSSEQLAKIAPALVAELQSQSFDDPALQQLHYAIYLAFSRRRSLLLLNLQSQVRIGELPWAAAIRRYERGDATARLANRRALELVARAAIEGFPQTILPNKLLQSLRDLATAAGVDLVLVPELATDIFEGRFTRNFSEAAKAAAKAPGDRMKLYERYYQLKEPYYHLVAETLSFGDLCYSLAEVCPEVSTTATNGTVLERAQILTTHNLAGLALALDLELDWAALAAKTWLWIVAELSGMPEDYTAQLRLRKDAAYAWRQLVFYVSQLPRAGQQAALTALATLDTRQAAQQHCVDRFLAPLVSAFNDEPRLPPLLGWTTEKINADGFFLEIGALNEAKAAAAAAATAAATAAAASPPVYDGDGDGDNA
jgi:hypothetical protein